MLIKRNLLRNPAITRYSQKQTNLLTRSSIYAGLAFLLVCLIGLGTYHIFQTNMNIAFNLGTIGSIFSLISFAMIIWFYISGHNWGIKKYIFLYLVYCISQGIGFGSLFLMFNGQELLFIFGLTGVIMLTNGIIAPRLSKKTAYTIQKALMISLISYFLFYGIYFLITMLNSSHASGESNSYLMIGLTMLMGLIQVLYNVYIFYAISKMDDFMNASNSYSPTLPLMFGFCLLVSAIGIIKFLASVLLLFRN